MATCCCCQTCENQGPYYTDQPNCTYGSSQITITTASGCTLDCWECDVDDDEKCEDLGSYYTEEPTCPTGMTKSQTTVTSVASNKTYTCWQCMFDCIPCPPSGWSLTPISSCPPGESVQEQYEGCCDSAIFACAPDGACCCPTETGTDCGNNCCCCGSYYAPVGIGCACAYVGA